MVLWNSSKSFRVRMSLNWIFDIKSFNSLRIRLWYHMQSSVYLDFDHHLMTQSRMERLEVCCEHRSTPSLIGWHVCSSCEWSSAGFPKYRIGWTRTPCRVRRSSWRRRSIQRSASSTSCRRRRPGIVDDAATARTPGAVDISALLHYRRVSINVIKMKGWLNLSYK